jgi:hypothetical protein
MRKHLSLLAISAFLLIAHATLAQSDAGWLRYPAISPDGNTILFNYKGDIYKVPSTRPRVEMRNG